MRIATDAPKPAWGDFEFAIECADRELRSYYDKVTGEVLVTGPFEDDPGEQERIDADPPRYLEIGHLDAETEFKWMERFTDTVANVRLQAQLEFALAGPKPFRRFKDALLSSPAERQAWFTYRDSHVKQWIEQWFEMHDLAVGAPPDWAKLQD